MATELAKAYVQIIPSAKGIKGMLQKELGGEVSAAGESAGKSFSGGLLSGLAGIGKAAAAALGAATAAVGAFAGASVKTGMAFDASMSQVAATMGKSMDEIGELRNFAMEMGATTAFSATQAADALNYMALAGYDTEQAMEALPNVLNLAAAGGIDLAAASDMVTDAQSALGLSMEEAAFLVDQMAMASSKSNTSVAQLGEAILTIGGTAKTLAGGTTELSTALGILADNGVKGAEGGTALRNIILSLSAPTGKAAKEMRQLGLDVFDAEGNMRPLEDVFTDLNGVLSEMTQGERTQILNELFNKVDLKSVNALLDTNVDRWEELSAAIDGADGAAEQMAETQLDNLAGDITLFQSALEGAQIVLSDQLTPSLRNFVQFGASGISQIADAFKEGGLSGAMEAFGTVLSDGLNMVITVLPDFVNAGMQLLGALGEGLIANLPVLMDAAFEIINMLISDIMENLPNLFTAASEILASLVSGIIEMLPELTTAAVELLAQFVVFLSENLDLLIDGALGIILALANGLIDALPSLLEKVPVIIENLLVALVSLMPKIIQAGVELIINLAGGLLKAIPKLVETVPRMIGALLNAIVASFGSIFEAGANILKKIGEGFKSLITNASSWGLDMIQGFINGILGAMNSLLNTVSSLAGKIKGFLHFSRPDTGPLRDYETWMPDFMQGLARGIDSNAWRVEDAVSGVADKLQIGMDAAFSPQLSVSRAATASESRQSAPAAYGDINITINGARYSDEQSLAQAIAQEIQFMTERRKAAYGTA